MTLLIVSTLIVVVYYCFFVRFGLMSIHQRIIAVGFMSSLQIILTELILGVLGYLYLNFLIIVNLGISILVLCLGCIIYKNNDGICFKNEKRALTNSLRNNLSVFNAILLFLLLFVIVWVVVVACVYSPKVWDESSYHLISIFEYVINHYIFLLPVNFHSHLAYPQNAELLLMWPIMFFHSQNYIGLAQLIFGLWGIVVVYGLARIIRINPKESLFVSLLFIFTPVVLHQLGVIYIDIICSVFYLTFIYYAMRFINNRDLFCFYSTALAAGLVFGMKYGMIIPTLLALLLFILKVRSIDKRHWIGFGLLFSLVGSYWYVRNLILLKTPFYPLFCNKQHFDSLGAFNPLEKILNNVWLLFKDSNFGLWGDGFGLIFLGVAFPAWIFICYKRFLKRSQIIEQKDHFLWIFFIFLIGILDLILLILIPMPFHQRYVIFIVAIAFLALGQVLIFFQEFKFFVNTLKIICVLFSFLAVLNLAGDRYYQLNPSLKEIQSKKHVLNSRYCNLPYARVGRILDYLTFEDQIGLSCYIWTAFEGRKTTSFIYGTHLQNRIWNIQPNRDLKPDVYIIPLKEPKAKNIIQELNHDPGYVYAFKADNQMIYIKKNYLLKAGKLNKLNSALKELLRGF